VDLGPGLEDGTCQVLYRLIRFGASFLGRMDNLLKE